MINFFTIVLLGLLILLKVILVTSLFKNIEISRSDKHFKTKTIIKDTVEGLLLLIIIFLLVYKYLQFMGTSNVGAYRVAILAIVLVFIFYVILNAEHFSKTLKENFKCKTVDDLEINDTDFLTEDKIFSIVPSNVRASCSGKDMYNFGNLYPFNSLTVKNLVGNRPEMSETVEAEFDEEGKDDFKFNVISLEEADNTILLNN